MTTVWKAAEKRERAAGKQRNRCYWCDRQMNRKPLDPHSATLEHIVPRAKGGPGSADNLVAAHRLCNQARGQMTPEDFQAFLIEERKKPVNP